MCQENISVYLCRERGREGENMFSVYLCRERVRDGETMGKRLRESKRT